MPLSCALRQIPGKMQPGPERHDYSEIKPGYYTVWVPARIGSELHWTQAERWWREAGRCLRRLSG
jgi:hypothetical protein